MMAYAPAENLVAIADAPPPTHRWSSLSIRRHIFPFTDWIVADPYKEMSDGMSSPTISASPKWSAERQRTW